MHFRNLLLSIAIAMANNTGEKFQYVPYSTGQPMTQPQTSDPHAHQLPSPHSHYDSVPQPKPRSKSYQSVELNTSASQTDATSKPARPKKPIITVPVRKAPLPPSETGGSIVKELAKKLDQERKQNISLEEATPTTTGRDMVPPILPSRIEQCFEKQTSVDSVVSPPPTKPRKRAKTISSISAPTPESLKWHHTGESMPLTQLANTHSSRFPLRIHLLDGYYGQTTRFTLSSSDIFDVHFAKRTQVVNVRDSIGTDYSVPLNSAIEFGVVYHQPIKHPDPKVPPPQMVYRTVEDLMSLAPLPKLVCATSKWSKASVKSSKISVEEGELLIVKGPYKPRLRNKVTALKCYSLKTETRKLLPEECVGNFSVEPEHTKLHVYEFAAKLKVILPCKAMMFLYQDSKYNSSVYSNVPRNLFQKPIIVRSVMSEVSLTVTSVTDNPTGLGPNIDQVNFQGKPLKTALTMEIPLDSHLGDIEVEILKAPSESETEKLYMNARELLQKANKEPYMILLDKGSDKINDAQSLFYMQIRSERSGLGVDYQTSSGIYESLDSKKNVKPASDSVSAASTTPTFDTKQDNILDSDDEHMYDEIDHELRASGLMSSAVQQLAPSSPPHFSPLKQPLHQGSSLSTPHCPTVPTNHYPQNSYQSPPFTPSQSLPHPQQTQSPSYVDMLPKASVGSGAVTHVSQDTKAVNRAFLKTMSLTLVSTLVVD